MRLIIGLLLTGLLATSLRADETSDFLKADNWEGLKELWKVEGTTIVGQSKEPLKFNTFLCSKKTYKDFELKFQVRLKDHVGNSGVQIRSKLIDTKQFVVAGPQCDIGAQFWGSLYGEKFGKDGKLPGSGHMMQPAPANLVKDVVKTKDFNDYHIIAKGKHITIKVNDKVMVDADFDNLPADGIIAFQLHAGPAMEATFKNITFKELK